MKSYSILPLFTLILLLGTMNAQAEPDAATILEEVSGHLGAQARFEFTSEVTYLGTFVHKFGSRNIDDEMLTKYRIAVDRSGMAAVSVDNAYTALERYTTGSRYTTYQPMWAQYVELDEVVTPAELVENSGFSVIEPIVRLLGELAKPAPFAEMFATAAYVGSETLNGSETHRIRATKEGRSFDLWIGQGETPQLLQIEADMADFGQQVKQEAGWEDVHISVTATISNWSNTVDETFLTFSPPLGGTRVEELQQPRPMSNSDSLSDAYESDGAMFRGNPARTGVYESGGPTELTELLWKFKTGGQIFSSPAVWDGVVYVGSRDSHLYAVDAKTGEEKWRFKTGAAVNSSPAISDGVVYVGSDDGNLYAVNAKTGEEKWKFKTGAAVGSSPGVSAGVVYVGSRDSHLYAMDAKTGEEKWRFETGAAVLSSPAISGSLVYFSSNDGRLYALNAEWGRQYREFQTGEESFSSPAISWGMMAYFGTDGGALHAVDITTGQQKFETYTFGVVASPAVLGGAVYFSTANGKALYAVDSKTGREKWEFRTGSPSVASPSISGKVLYFGDYSGQLFAVDIQTGKEKWRFKTDGYIESSPAISEGVVYFGSFDGNLYAVK